MVSASCITIVMFSVAVVFIAVDIGTSAGKQEPGEGRVEFSCEGSGCGRGSAAPFRHRQMGRMFKNG